MSLPRRRDSPQSPYQYPRNLSPHSTGASLFSSTEMLTGADTIGRSSQIQSNESTICRTQEAVNEILSDSHQARRFQIFPADEAKCSKTWRKLSKSEGDELVGICEMALEQTQTLKSTAMCTMAILVAIFCILGPADPGILSADKTFLLSITLSLLNLCVANLVEHWTRGCMKKIAVIGPDEINLFFGLVQRLKHYMQYGITAILLRTALLSTDFNLWLVICIMLGRMANLDETTLGMSVMIFILFVKAASSLCPTIRSLHTSPEVHSPFMSRPALVLKIIRSWSRHSHRSGAKPPRQICRWKYGMGLGSDLELCVLRLWEMAITPTEFDISLVFICLRDYANKHPQHLIKGVGCLTLIESSGASYVVDDTQGPSEAEDVLALYIAHFFQSVAESSKQLEASRTLAIIRVKLGCDLLHRGMVNQRMLASAKAIFTIPQVFRTSGFVSGIDDDLLIELLRVAAVAYDRKIELEELMIFLEDYVARLLTPDIIHTIRCTLGRAICGFTGVWAKCDSNSEQFRRYRRQLLEALQAEEVQNAWLRPELMQALDYH